MIGKQAAQPVNMAPNNELTAQPVNMGPNNELTALVREGMPKRKRKVPEMSRQPQSNGRVDNKKRTLVIEDDEQSVDTTEGEKVTWRVRDGDEREVEIKIKSTHPQR